MFAPKYTITHQLLANITRIHSLVQSGNMRKFPKVVLAEFESLARVVSTHASTSIEGNPLPLTEVRKILKSTPMHLRDSEKEIVNYNRALEVLHTTIQTKDFVLSRTYLCKIHKLVTQGLLPHHECGKLRKHPVIVNDPRTGKIVYLPPDVDQLPALLEDLFAFIKESSIDVDPLLLAGIFHKQMVIIHPFMDGNGRTTRLLTKVLLAKMGLDTFNLFSFENYYNQNVTKYFQSVGEYGDYNELVSRIDFTDWLEYFTGGIIDELLRVQKTLPTINDSVHTKLDPDQQKLVAYIRRHGCISGKEYELLTERAKATRTLDFAKLRTLGMIERKGAGRSTYYVLSNQ